MGLIEAIILGLVQGLTEFLPISSSGHLVLVHSALGAEEVGLAFDVALHAGTLFALLGYFRKDVTELFWSLVKKSEKTRLARLFIIATIPAAVFGYFLEDAAQSTFRSVPLVALTMLGFGFVMLAAERVYKSQTAHQDIKHVSLKQAMAIGFAQALALVPGVSRSGSTITAGLFVGLSHVAATRFSFLLGIPITIGAVLKVFTRDDVISQVQSEQSIFAVGMIAAFLSGVFAIRFMLRYLSKHGLHVFAYYRIILGLAVLIGVGVR